MDIGYFISQVAGKFMLQLLRCKRAQLTNAFFYNTIDTAFITAALSRPFVQQCKTYTRHTTLLLDLPNHASFDEITDIIIIMKH
jgi:hypothetical protein